jgi:hypothetical protein
MNRQFAGTETIPTRFRREYELNHTGGFLAFPAAYPSAKNTPGGRRTRNTPAPRRIHLPCKGTEWETMVALGQKHSMQFFSEGIQSSQAIRLSHGKPLLL